MRKTPIKHHVKSHSRKDGTHVKSYVRGHGAQKRYHPAKPTLNKPEGYTVTLRYSDKPYDLEKLEVIATSYTRAIDEAFEDKHDSRQPIEISVVDPSLGEVIHWAGEHAAKYGKIAAKKSFEYGKKTAIAGGNFAKQQIKSNISDYHTKQLIEQAYSPNRGVRVLARAKLRKEYPEVWETMDISR